MSLNRVIYNIQDLLVGPANNSQAILLADTHVLQRLQRVTACSYSLNTSKIDVNELGSEKTVFTPIVSPVVNLNFQYNAINVANELRLGLIANYNISGAPLYNNFVSPISGLYNKSREWDKRSIYLVTNSHYDDLHRNSSVKPWTGLSGSITGFFDIESSGYQLFCFNNSYLTSYETSAAIGDFPKVGVGYTIDNICFFVSGSGIKVPILDSRTARTVSSEFTAAIPYYYVDGQPSALRPGDITFNVSGNNLGADFSDCKVQSYNIATSLSRETTQFLGFKAAQDREITLPVFANISIDMIVGRGASGNFLNLLHENQYYNFSISVRNPNSTVPLGQETALRYDILNAQFQDINYQSDIGSNKQATLNFRVEVIPNNSVTGLFISGIIENPSISPSLIMAEDFDYLSTEDGFRLRAEDILMKPTVF
jgi:hypothetical protein